MAGTRPHHARTPQRPKKPLRGLLRGWHRWFGLIVGPWLLLLALTGSAIAFYDDLDSWLNPSWRTVPAEQAVLTPAVDSAMLQAATQLPGFAPRFINLPNTPTQTIITLGSYVPNGSEPLEVETFSHPATGELLGWRETDRLGFDPPHLMNTLYGLHVDLLLGSVAGWLIGLVSLLWALDHVPAVILAIPRLKNALSAFVIKTRSGALRRLYDLHRAPGLWFYPVTLVLAVTGVGLSWPDESRDAVGLFSPISERLHYEMPDFPENAPPAIGIDRALAAFATSHGSEVDSVLPLPHKGLYAIRSFDARDPDDFGRLWTYVSMTDGQTIAQRHDVGTSAGDTVFAWLYPLHSGRAFGDAGRWLVLISGLVTALLCLTGYILWYKRKRTRT